MFFIEILRPLRSKASEEQKEDRGLEVRVLLWNLIRLCCLRQVLAISPQAEQDERRIQAASEYFSTAGKFFVILKFSIASIIDISSTSGF